MALENYDINNKMKYKKVLVTGVGGFIGFHLSKMLLDLGVEVVGIDNINDYYDVNLKYARLNKLGIKRSDAEEWNVVSKSLTNSQFSFIRMSIEDGESLTRLFKISQFEAVVHLAAQVGVRYSLKNPTSYIENNVMGFLKVLEACRDYDIKHLVYASSSSVYGENGKVPFSESDHVDSPVSLYAATKKCNELMAHTFSHLYNIPTSGLRFFTVYGPWGRPDMAPFLFASAIAENRPINVFNNGVMSRDFTYIDDIVQGIIITLDHPPKKEQEKPFYQLFNIGNGSPVSLMEFIEALENNLGKIAEKHMLPMQPGDVPRTWADTTKLNSLGYESTTEIKKGVKQFVEWFNDYHVK